MRPASAQPPVAIPPGRYLAWATLYAAFVVYGSLIPFEYAGIARADAVEKFRHIPWLRLGVASRADWVANVLLYLTLGLLLAGAKAGSCRSSARRARAYLGVFAVCAVFAAAVEFLQLFFPRRTVSLNDIVAEILGSALGIALWHGFGDRLERFRLEWAGEGAGRARLLVLAYLAAYVLLALFPFDFLLSRKELAFKLRDGAEVLWLARSECPPAMSCAWLRLTEVLAAFPLGLAPGFLRPHRTWSGGAFHAACWGLGLGFGIETLQLLTASNVGQAVSALCRGLGVVLGYAAFGLAPRNTLAAGLARLARFEVAIPVALAYGGAAAKLAFAGNGPWLDLPAARQRLRELSFFPFYYHYFTTEALALEGLLLNFALYAPIGVLVFSRRAGSASILPGNGLRISAGMGALAALAMETVKLFLAGTQPDPTNLLVAAGGAVFGYWAAEILYRAARDAGPRPAEAAARRAGPIPSRFAVALLLSAAGAGLVGALPTFPSAPVEQAADERYFPKLPEASQLPDAALPGFKPAHPRLPVPSEQDLARLRAENPGFLERTAARAQDGRGPVDALILAAYTRSAAIDLALLFHRLMEQKFTGRGNEQVKPLALAYDWFYDRWTPEQRAALLDKTLAGCRYEIDLIRNQRLSPYNVFLYNSPLQALMACAIAVYGDRPDARPVMNFTHDLWKNRVLPVWRQVMGRNGGWHEGGEYVGIGIGQAVYQLPAMWRAATGEDLFRSEPGLRGFPDFLVHRTRPDGTQIRLGDAAFFRRDAPDRVPLALEYGHAAAYGLGGCPRPDEPSAWPWGPLTRASLCRPESLHALPPDRLFDGIGLVTARSDWGPDATLVTFKAGDNYWSHSHLDQGSFTLYKGGALAIDSGFYGPVYGSEHHLNYAAQTVAHNAVTVTDPEDTASMPTPRGPKQIANDGGQRRVGSGWGLAPAPLDLAEWQRQGELYHTGSLLAYLSAGDLVVAVADLTPAYTDIRSRKGSFFHRTRRVERLLRTFLYDRVNDLVVIHDRVRATDPRFHKVSMVHSLERPERTAFGFRILTPARWLPGQAGGTLDVHVLWPEGATVDLLGGPGAEFRVAGRTYDEQGGIWAAMEGRTDAEPGRWRAEIRPGQPALENDFLLVLIPRLADRPDPAIRVRRSATVPGCEIAGPARTVTIVFPEDSDLPAIELDGRRVELKGSEGH